MGVYVGIKCFIATAVCVATTMLTLGLLSSGYAGWMCAVDVAVNSICTVLMTAYYSDKIYYQRYAFFVFFSAQNNIGILLICKISKICNGYCCSCSITFYDIKNRTSSHSRNPRNTRYGLQRLSNLSNINNCLSMSTFI